MTTPATSSPGMSVTPGGGGYTPMRWAISGRLTPAAMTLMRISPAPGCGTGRSCGTSVSGPPADVMPIAVMVAGIDVLGVLIGQRGAGRLGYLPLPLATTPAEH